MVKFISIFNIFIPFNIITNCKGHTQIQPKWNYWANRGISKQTIFDWNRKGIAYLSGGKIYQGDTQKNKWKLNYAFFGALLVEATWEEACSFMTIAGYPSKNVPSNHKDNRTLVAACYQTIDYVYAKMPKIECDNNDTRMMRLDLAEAYIIAYEPHLYIAIFAEE